MNDKTRLELDIEHKERLKTPVSIKILIVLLIAGLCVIGMYAAILKQDILKKEQEMILMQENVRKEKAQLSNRIKQMKEERESDKK
ncbi:MAG: hypothetical protein KAJ10_06055 [Thermodesulfovibrionia bacterium]|jgi:hypothetical protein|nr:hypothetical protein [Thermodesulfovibrionia bacterium]